MGLEIRLGRDGQPRKHWYGSYTDGRGRRTSANLGILIAGKPPASGRPSEVGDKAFEKSKTAARVQLKKLKDSGQSGRIDKAQAFRLYKDATNEEMPQTPISSLDSFLKADGKHITKEWQAYKKTVVERFTSWAGKHGVKIVLDVDRERAQKYLEAQYAEGVTARTISVVKCILGRVFEKALPEGAPNPWKATSIRPSKGDKEIHRTPLTTEEVERLLYCAKEDRTAHDLIATALCTGLRRGDCCRLKWSCVDLKGNALKIETSKTKTEIFLPILPALKAVLESRLAERADDAVYVFPEAERMLRKSRDGITWRVKKVLATAFSNPVIIEDDAEETKEENTVNLAEVLPQIKLAVESATIPEAKRAKMLDVLTRHANGQSYRVIGAETGIARGSISEYLHSAEKLAKVSFMPDRRNAYGIKRAIYDLTTEARTVGYRRASKYDFHALRTTFVTLAISNGFSIDKLKSLTGHKTVEIVLRHYFKPRGTDFAEDLSKAMPAALTTIREPMQIESEETEIDGAKIDALADALKKLLPVEKIALQKALRKSTTIKKLLNNVEQNNIGEHNLEHR